MFVIILYENDFIQTTVKINAKSSVNSVSASNSILTSSIPTISLTFDYLYYEYWNEDQDGREYSEGSDETLFVSLITKADGASESFTTNPPAFTVVLNGTTICNSLPRWVTEAPLEGCDEMLFDIINPGIVFKITYGGYDYQFTAKEVEFVTHSPSQENKDRIQYIKDNL